MDGLPNEDRPKYEGDTKERTDDDERKKRRDVNEKRRVGDRKDEDDDNNPGSSGKSRTNEDDTIADKRKLKVNIREDMVQNAIQFLNNPSVRGTPLVRKVAFLEKKGLSSEEIKEALRRSGESRALPTDHEEEEVVPVRARTVQRPPPPPPAPTTSLSLKGIAITAAAVVGVTGGLLFFVKSYVAPHMWQSASTIQSLKDANAQTTQTIAEIRSQMSELKDTISSLKGMLQQSLSQQETKAKNDEIAQLKRDLETLSGASQQLLQDEKAREVAELKAQIATLKASITARQSAAAPPPIPSARSTLTWTPVDNPKQIPSWQRPATPTSTTTTASGPSTTTLAEPTTVETEQHTPYSQNYLDIMNTVNAQLPIAELNKRLGIRTDINDKPVGDIPLTKGSKQPRSKPWEAAGSSGDVQEEETKKEGTTDNSE